MVLTVGLGSKPELGLGHSVPYHICLSKVSPSALPGGPGGHYEVVQRLEEALRKKTKIS